MTKKSSRIYWILGSIIALELISPLPAFLTFGSLFILLRRPPWFRRWIDELYEERA